MNAQTFEFSQTRRGVEFRPMLAGDAMLLSLQPSQQFELGLDHKSYSLEEGEDLAENGLAWTAYRGARIVTIAGFREIYPGHAIVWAALSDAVGRDHLAITRFARRQVLNAPYRRLEAIIEADKPRAIAWAKLVGLELVHELRCYGREGKTHLLFERISEDRPCK